MENQPFEDVFRNEKKREFSIAMLVYLKPPTRSMLNRKPQPEDRTGIWNHHPIDAAFRSKFSPWKNPRAPLCIGFLLSTQVLTWALTKEIRINLDDVGLHVTQFKSYKLFEVQQKHQTCMLSPPHGKAGASIMLGQASQVLVLTWVGTSLTKSWVQTQINNTWRNRSYIWLNVKIYTHTWATFQIYTD